MGTLKILSVIVIISSMLYWPAVSSAVVSKERSVSSKGQATNSDSTSDNRIIRVTAIVKEMNKNVLVLTDGRRYDLSGVTVIDKTSKKNAARKTAVEMTFINNTLNQVVIH